MNCAIKIKNLRKQYGTFSAVNGLNLEVPQGKIYGFLGKNGAGKTTTIRMIMGLIKPTNGQIEVCGNDISTNPGIISKKIGAIVENPTFYPNLTARENLKLMADLFSSNKLMIDELLKVVELKEFANRKVKAFSLGMKQRLGIACSLVNNPEILILDEPANGLDPAGIKELREFLKFLNRSRNLTVFISSHILSEIQQMADIVGIIDKGRLLREINASDLNIEHQSYLEIDSDDNTKALRVLKDMNYTVILEDGKIRVSCKKSLNSIIIKTLVKNNLELYEIKPAANSLEDIFIAVTEGK